MKKKKSIINDILLKQNKDRRLLSNVPDKEAIRTNKDRRGKFIGDENSEDPNEFIISKNAGIRYEVKCKVIIEAKKDGRVKNVKAESKDMSATGILLKINNPNEIDSIKEADKLKLKFTIEPGAMPEGYEMKVSINGKMVREFKHDDGSVFCGIMFEESLSEYANRKRGRYMLGCSSIMLFLITLFIILMRAESVIYFKFNKMLYLYSIIAAIFLLSRYIFGMFYKTVPIDMNFTPSVSIIIPCFNEEEWIERTILSCINQDYPIDKLEVMVVDDCSTDNSVEKIKSAIERLYNEADRFETKKRLKYIVQDANKGKREALARGVMEAKGELVVFVDSDSFLDPFAIRNLVQPFRDPKMAGVSGRTDVANTYTNTLTKMQSVRYFIAFRVMKAAEAYFDSVTCLSGPLSCYKKGVVLENIEAWLNQSFLGQKATFGDDRAMTNFVLENHRTSYQDTAICSTIVPNSYKVFIKQQMRWKRSWLRESLMAGRFIWKKEPFMAVFFYVGLLVPVLAPVVVIYNLIYVPIAHHVFPTTFLVGLLMMALMMSFAQMFLRKSTTWIFGMLFCIYYEAVLLWQMPIAVFTFWKSTWGTRMTKSDVEEQKKKEMKAQSRKRYKKEVS